jgi:hypothetical protein
MQIRVKTATRFLYFGPIAIAKQVNITAISNTKLITHVEKEVYIRTPSSSFDAGQSLTVFIYIYSLAFVSFWPVNANTVPPKTHAIEEKI